MTSRNYWVGLFTVKTWEEFAAAGGKVSGFRESRWKTVQKIHSGDVLLCYLVEISRFVAALEVTAEPFQEKTPIWSDELFPCRLRVKPLVFLTPETAVPVQTLRESLSFFQGLESPLAWTSHFRGSPALWKAADGKAVLAALQEAAKTPQARPFDRRKLAQRPKPVSGPAGPVTIPDESTEVYPGGFQPKVPAEHTEIQALLAQLGANMGFDIWVAKNDRGRESGGRKLADFPRLRADLPRQFDEATRRTVELIDVLWLKGNAFIAAFEIECTTSVYSGLLRLADLLVMQPDLALPLYLVAPEERRDKVFAEVNRPAFRRLEPPLAEICRFIPFDLLKRQIEKVASIAQYLKPEFLDELSESCAIEEI